jgi:hypothetical protein
VAIIAALVALPSLGVLAALTMKSVTACGCESIASRGAPMVGRSQEYPWRRMRQYRALSRGRAHQLSALYWAGCIIDMYGFDLRQAQVVQIEDTGPGIPLGDIDRIFEPFFRGSRPSEDGTGLGLSIVKRVVDRLGGRVVLENISGRPSKGLRATVRLPVLNGLGR